MPHHISATRPRMSTRDRAAQFAPFAALTGYDGVIREADRVTEGEVTLADNAIEALDRALRMLHDGQSETQWVRLRYFVPDLRKQGGVCRYAEGEVIKVDTQGQRLILKDGVAVSFVHLLELQFCDQREKM